ncbi:Probable beta-1,3-galactosyltransferase 2 [Linum grandiflorum]
MPQGEKRDKLEKEKGIVIRFVIGHSSTSSGIDAEDEMHGDFMRLDHIEGYLALSAKTKTYFSTAVALWDANFYVKVDDDVHVNLENCQLEIKPHFIRIQALAVEAEEIPSEQLGCHKDHVEGYLALSAKTKSYFSTAVTLWDANFYVKVDDDVHVNLATLGSILAEHNQKSRVYIGCMKSGPVLAKKGVKYHEPEFWKFGEVGNKYFRHATGQLYAISKDLATYISVNQQVLHKYANEDVSLGTWILGLDVEHVDERRLCCGTPPDCETRARLGSTCAVSFDWKCSGICKSVERMAEIHRLCGEDKNAIWSATF